MSAPTIGIYSPGAMGSALGRAWQRGGARVVATVAGRSARTQALADGLELLPDLMAVVEASDLVISIDPPTPTSATRLYLSGPPALSPEDAARATDLAGTLDLLATA